MIRKIQSIKNLGVFKSFSWGNQLPEFKEKNIIYGWNYTGKTTLSRLFSSLKHKQCHPSFSGAEFKVKLSDNSEITHTDIANCVLAVEVFNCEYIRENLKWEIDGNVNGISFDVGENVTIREEIEKNLEQIHKVAGDDTIKGRKEPYAALISDFSKFDATKFTVESKRIKNDIFNSLIEFDKSHFGKIKNQIVSNLPVHIIVDDAELSRIKKISLATNDKQKIDSVVFESRLRTIYDETKAILQAEPQRTDLIDALDSDSDLYNWAKAGLPLHRAQSKCSFCDNEINPERIILLNSYFSNEASKVRDNITKCRGNILFEADYLNDLQIPVSKNDFSDSWQDGYQAQLDNIKTIKEEYSEYLNTLLMELNKKERNSIFNAMNIADFEPERAEIMQGWVEATNVMISSHNDFIANFDKEQENARELLKKHHVARFLIDEDYLKKEQDKTNADRCIKRYDCFVKKVQSANKTLEGQLKSVVAGRNELNDFIKKILNRDDIVIEVTEDDKFILKRGEKIAENLSEGEKMAISFAYFLVSLESLHRDGKLKDVVVFIDDPISSLDGNHIAQIYSLINSFFFRQGEDPAQPAKFVNCFKQLFISTHNFDFFSFLKDSNRINKRQSGQPAEHEYYFVKRIAKDQSDIQSMPKSLKNHKSEYIYLFEIIFNFHKDGCQEADEKLILMPNAVRRFLEIYTLMKLPGSNEEVDGRLRILMPDPTQLKTLHHFSHFTTVEKVTKHDELLMNLPEAVGELISLLSNDSTHFDSLKRAVGEA